MGLTKDGKSKGKGIEGEEGPSKRYKASHPQADALALVPFHPVAPKTYPFRDTMIMTSLMTKQEAKLNNFKVLNLIYPDLGLLDDLGMRTILERPFDLCGLGFVFENNPPLVYESMVWEFVYSFQSVWDVAPKDVSMSPNEEKFVTKWKFRLGGVDYVYSRSDLVRALTYLDRRAAPYVSKSDGDRIWREITDGITDFVPAQSTKIIVPEWRLAHRFLTCSVILCADEGRWVSKTDFELLCRLYIRRGFDTLTPNTRSLEESTTSNFKGKYIAGGPFVYMIAEDFGLVLDQGFCYAQGTAG